MVIVYLAIACGLGALVRYFFSRYNQAAKIAYRNADSQSFRLFFDWIISTIMWSLRKVYAILATGFCGV